MKYLYETHMHTSEVSACARSTAAEQVRAYKRLGYSGIIITDHFINGYSTCPTNAPWDVKVRHFTSGFEYAKAVGDECGLNVFFGWEYTIRGSDFLTYGLDLDFLLAHPNVDKLTIEDYSSLVRENGGFLAQAHPYRDADYIERKYPVDHHLVDAVEAYNSMDSDMSNSKTLAFAKRYGLPIQAGSDSHSTSHSRYSGIKLQKKAESIFDIIDAIKEGNINFI